MQDKNKLLIIDFATRVGEVSEILAKNLLSIDGIAKDIPGFSSVMALGNIMITIKANMFENKVRAFLYEFNESEFNKFKKAISKKDDEHLGQVVLSAIDSVDKPNQAQMIARATKVYISDLEQQKENSKHKFDHNIHAIRGLDDYLLTGMQSIYGEIGTPRIASVDQALFNLGLVEEEEKVSLASKTHPKITFKASKEGQVFYDTIILGNNM